MIIAVDYDGGCVRGYEDNREVPGARRSLRRLVDSGHTRVRWTARTGRSLGQALRTLESWDIPMEHPVWQGEPLYEGEGRKITYDLLIDDRAVGCPMVHATNGDYDDGYYVDWPAIMQALDKLGILIPEQEDTDNAKHQQSDDHGASGAGAADQDDSGRAYCGIVQYRNKLG